MKTSTEWIAAVGVALIVGAGVAWITVGRSNRVPTQVPQPAPKEVFLPPGGARDTVAPSETIGLGKSVESFHANSTFTRSFGFFPAETYVENCSPYVGSPNSTQPKYNTVYAYSHAAMSNYPTRLTLSADQHQIVGEQTISLGSPAFGSKGELGPQQYQFLEAFVKESTHSRLQFPAVWSRLSSFIESAFLSYYHTGNKDRQEMKTTEAGFLLSYSVLFDGFKRTITVSIGLVDAWDTVPCTIEDPFRRFLKP